jgi:hypothetical protein
MSNIFITTTGATPSIILRDLGERILTHPLINYNIGTEFKYQELIESSDFSSALDNAYLTMTYNGILATSSNGTLPLSSSLTASYIIIGNSNNLSYPREIGGDMSLSSTGSLMVNSDSITDGKIISHTSSKISIAAKSQLNSNISYTDQSNTFGTFSQSFKSSNLYLSNPANTFNYQFVGSGITSTMSVTLPLLTSNDTFVFQSFSQSMTNKTLLSTNNNVIDATRLQTFTVSTATPSNNNMLSYNGSSWAPVKSTILLGYNTGTSSTLVNSVAESNFTSNGFSYSIAPNTLNVNSILRIAAYGKFSTKNGGVGSLTIRLKIGSVTYNTNALTTLSSAVTNAGIRIDGQFQFRSIGSSGTVHSHLIVNPSGVASVLTTSNGTASVDTTISNSVQLSAQWSTADVLNNIQLEQITFELLN